MNRIKFPSPFLRLSLGLRMSCCATVMDELVGPDTKRGSVMTKASETLPPPSNQHL